MTAFDGVRVPTLVGLDSLSQGQTVPLPNRRQFTPEVAYGLILPERVSVFEVPLFAKFSPSISPYYLLTRRGLSCGDVRRLYQ